MTWKQAAARAVWLGASLFPLLTGCSRPIDVSNSPEGAKDIYADSDVLVLCLVEREGNAVRYVVASVLKDEESARGLITNGYLNYTSTTKARTNVGEQALFSFKLSGESKLVMKKMWYVYDGKIAQIGPHRDGHILLRDVLLRAEKWGGGRPVD